MSKMEYMPVECAAVPKVLFQMANTKICQIQQRFYTAYFWIV